jgi:hypothetical protein
MERGKMNRAIKTSGDHSKSKQCRTYECKPACHSKNVIRVDARASITHDAHGQRGEDIAIYEENNFWQPPSEAWK